MYYRISKEYALFTIFMTHGGSNTKNKALDKGAKAIQWSKNSLSKNGGQEMVTQSKTMNLDLNISPFTKTNSKWNTDLMEYAEQ